MTHAPFRRIVTGHNSEGKAVVLEDSAPPRTARIAGAIGPMFYEVWNTRETPAPIDRASGEPAEQGIVLAPPKNGTRIRVLDIPPEDERIQNISPEEARAHFAEIGAAGASSHTGENARHPFMHRTETVDYGIVLEGERTLLLDRGNVVMKAGDVVVQLGNWHGWTNVDSGSLMAFLMMGARVKE